MRLEQDRCQPMTPDQQTFEKRRSVADIGRRVSQRLSLWRVSAPALALLVAWWLLDTPLPRTIWIGLLVYAVAHLALRLAARGEQSLRSIRSTWQHVIIDTIAALLLLGQASALGAQLVPLFVVLLIRAVADQQPLARVVPIAVGALAPVLGAVGGGIGVLPLVAVALSANALLHGVSQHRNVEGLRRDLRNERATREARVEELERITTELRSRMRERQALEEGLRVITSSLSLDYVLTQIVESAVQTFGNERVHGTALTIEVDGEIRNQQSSTGPASDVRWAEAVTRQVITQATPVVTADAALSPELAAISRLGYRSVLSVPLYVGEGPPRGALTLASSTFACFSPNDARRLAAFALQAGIALGNAEMLSRINRQQRLLEAVLRDINDGLVVFDTQRRVVLANRLGRQILAGETDNGPVLDRMLTMADTLTADSTGIVVSDLRVTAGPGERDSDLHYTAFASEVRRDDSAERLTAIVLHDVSAQKAEEKARAEFISMVSHELRNPVHSINGFLKVVLQGRAGELNEMQREFLQMADEQLERLKGRVAELLEYNRSRAGKLSLNPAMSNLNDLIQRTTQKLTLQAEQSNLRVINDVVEQLPTCLCDAQRIGQVLTNLIENAIKATPAGGHISVNAEIHDHEVQIAVSDTGVGIPAEDLHRVFQRFYRVQKHIKDADNHLGLGLAICQQIVEGHGGRMWVESTVGVGTRFTFALPLASNEVAVAA